jgi:Fe-S-cluster-containing dehydrogenase component
MKHFVLDLDKCNGCYCCQVVCKDEHVANDWTPYTKPQPDVGQFWIKLHETVRGSVPKVKVSYFPQMCLHCTEAQCMAACQTEGAIYRRPDGLVIIDPLICTGCKRCQDACSHEAIYFNEDLNIAQKCTGCAHLLDDGWSEPRCVDACPTNALRYEEESDLKDQIQAAEPMNCGGSGGALVHYLNMPKGFVAGTVYDPVEKEVVFGATCTLVGADNTVFQTETDDFGDFWFRDVVEGQTYHLTVEKGGASKAIGNIVAGKGNNLGDIPMRVPV